MAEGSHRENEIVPFIKRHDYKIIRELGQGACGQTVLLHDEQIDLHYVCKKYVQRAGILHRDIRMQNFMVRKDGRLKIIDLGFGKRAETSADFDKSISLNWWCQTPDEFQESRYDFTTEVYFVGKLFERL